LEKLNKICWQTASYAEVQGFFEPLFSSTSRPTALLSLRIKKGFLEQSSDATVGKKLERKLLKEFKFCERCILSV
jgi:hypothetical protein